MKPTYWILRYLNPSTGKTEESPRYYQRAAARGAAMIQRAQGMRDVTVIPIWEN